MSRKAGEEGTIAILKSIGIEIDAYYQADNYVC